jgi:hypothetical protein
MDLSAVKSKLTDLSKPAGQKREKVDFSKIMWKPKPGKYQIRIVPSLRDKAYPFHEVYIHYGISKFPIFALNNWDEQDPIVEFASKLKKENDKESWKLAKKLEPKMRVFVPVVVRGEEDKGVRLWEFGVTIYKQLLALVDDEDYSNYEDINEGRDFTAVAAESETAGRKSVSVTLTIKPKVTPLSTDAATIESWLNNQPDILSVQRHYKYEELKEVLQNFLAPEEEAHEEEIASVEDVDDLPFSVPEESKKAKNTNANKFDKLF